MGPGCAALAEAEVGFVRSRSLRAADQRNQAKRNRVPLGGSRFGPTDDGDDDDGDEQQLARS